MISVVEVTHGAKIHRPEAASKGDRQITRPVPLDISSIPKREKEAERYRRVGHAVLGTDLSFVTAIVIPVDGGRPLGR